MTEESNEEDESVEVDPNDDDESEVANVEQESEAVAGTDDDESAMNGDTVFIVGYCTADTG